MKFLKIIFFILPFTILIGCEKTEGIHNTSTQVGESKVTFFVDLTLTGNPVISHLMGTPFVDPGVVATENGQPVPTTTSGTVNINQVGLYILTYTAVNQDGFAKSISRTVVVRPANETPGLDLSGTYLPIGGAPANAVITKVGNGLYYTTNCWGGGSSVVINAYFICVNGTSVILPLQNNALVGRIQSEGAGTYAGGLITWTITRLDFSSGPLTVEKRWQKI